MKTALKMQKESLIKFELNEFTFMTENEIRRSFETGRVNGIFIAVVAYALFVNINKYFYIKLFIFICIKNYHFYFL